MSGAGGASTQVGIVGAGPAGLMLALLLQRAGVECVVLEARSEEYVLGRVRAGVLEQGTVDLLGGLGIDQRLRREGLAHHGIEIRVDGEPHRIAFEELVPDREVTIYGQQEVVKDLIAAAQEREIPVLFEAEVLSLRGIEGDQPLIAYSEGGQQHELRCEVIAGCDGYHGVCRRAIPAGVLTVKEHEYPFGWLGILAEVAPSHEELIYASSERGFALHSMRSPELTRLYVQCPLEDELSDWSDDRIWEELHLRLAMDGWSLAEGPIIERGIVPLRSFVVEPMQYGRLFLAGDSAHIVPPTGAKGLNLAAADVSVLAGALIELVGSGEERLAEAYSRTCLKRVWRAQWFSAWMTSMLHRFPEDSDFERSLRRAQLECVGSSRAAATMLAEHYVGLALATTPTSEGDR